MNFGLSYEKMEIFRLLYSFKHFEILSYRIHPRVSEVPTSRPAQPLERHRLPHAHGVPNGVHPIHGMRGVNVSAVRESEEADAPPPTPGRCQVNGMSIIGSLRMQQYQYLCFCFLECGWKGMG